MMKGGAGGTDSEIPVLYPATDGSAVFTAVPAAIFNITDRKKKRYKKLHTRFPERKSEHGVFLQCMTVFSLSEPETIRSPPAFYCEITPRTPFVGV